LRNYGEYLGLNADSLFASYRAIRIQEQPVPVEQLLRSPSPLPKIIRNVAIILIIAGAGGFAVWFFQQYQSRRGSERPESSRSSGEWTMDGSFVERRFYEGDTVIIPLDSSLYKIGIAGLGEAVSLSTPAGARILDLGQQVSVDLDRDGIGNIMVTALDFSRTDPDAGVLLRLDLEYAAAAQAPQTGTAGADQAAAPAQALPPAQNSAGAAPAANTAPSVPVFSSINAWPFTLQVSFQGYCMFRWEILFERDRRERKEEYFSRGQPINIQAQNGIRIWSSNAQAAKFQVIGGGRSFPIELGGAGEVVVAEIRWVRDNDNRYRLVLARLETGNT
jgi:cytoskeletal protein RodZ